MPFDLHIIRRPKGLPVTISLRARKEGVVCFLSIAGDLAKQIGGTEKSAFDVLIGSGDDAGRLILRVNKDGVCRARKTTKGGWLVFDLGHVAAFPSEEVDKQRCDARKSDDATIEITLPVWADVIADYVDEAPDPEQEPERKATASAAPKPEKLSTANGGGAAPKRMTHYGVTIDFKHEDESVSFAGKSMDLTTRQAAVLAATLRVYPNVIGRDFLIRNTLYDVPSHSRDASLDLIVRDLTKACDAVGLKLKPVKGVGWTLNLGES